MTASAQHGETLPGPGRMPVIGLAGGIGSGKSAVARVLEGLGCVVSDSDTEAKAMLDEPEVRGLIEARWAGSENGPVFGADGRADRGAIARIVFSDQAERAWLESVVHPRLHAQRAERRQEAEHAGAQGFVIDAPLLFEAGLEAECDAVIFVDCPRETRLRRVRENRGWDEAELARREKAQMPLDDKRRRSDYVVRNAGDQAALEAGVREAFRHIRRDTPC